MAGGSTEKGTGTARALTKSLRALVQMVPIVLGMLLLTSLMLAWLPRADFRALFGAGNALDVLVGALLGSIAAGHPLAGYILGGELLSAGVSLVAVTALLVTWVSVGVVQLPAEGLMLGWRFALLRNLLCFLSALVMAPVVVE